MFVVVVVAAGIAAVWIAWSLLDRGFDFLHGKGNQAAANRERERIRARIASENQGDKQ
jgi:hypothetical protein